MPLFLFGCGRTTPPDFDESFKTPEFHFDAGAVFVGEIPRLTSIVPIQNNSGRSVRFDRVTKNCACSGAELEKSDLAPGETTTLAFSANLLGRSGPQRFTCELIEEDGTVWRVEISAIVYEFFKVSSHTINFGQLSPLQSATKQLVAQCSAMERSTLPEAVSLSEQLGPIQVQIGLPVTSQDDHGMWHRKWNIDLSVSADQIIGTHQQLFQITPSSPPIDMPASTSICVQWTVKSLYSQSAKRAYFPSSPDRTANRTTTINFGRSDGQKVQVRKISSMSKWLTIDSRSLENGTLDIIIEVDPALSSDANADLSIQMDDEYYSILRIPVAVAARGK